jgi:hypothetical protein
LVCPVNLTPGSSKWHRLMHDTQLSWCLQLTTLNGGANGKCLSVNRENSIDISRYWS